MPRYQQNHLEHAIAWFHRKTGIQADFYRSDCFAHDVTAQGADQYRLKCYLRNVNGDLGMVKIDVRNGRCTMGGK